MLLMTANRLVAEALDTPFLLLPFRPETDTASAKTFVGNFFKANREGSQHYTGSSLRRELVLTDPAVRLFVPKILRLANITTGSVQYPQMVLESHARRSCNMASIRRVCPRRTGYVLSFCPAKSSKGLTRSDSNMARTAFHTFIPLTVDSNARKNIIYDFFDLLTAIAAHGKTNGLGGRKLSRMAGWWAFEHSDDGKGFEGGYRMWLT